MNHCEQHPQTAQSDKRAVVLVKSLPPHDETIMMMMMVMSRQPRVEYEIFALAPRLN